MDGLYWTRALLLQCHGARNEGVPCNGRSRPNGDFIWLNLVSAVHVSLGSSRHCHDLPTFKIAGQYQLESVLPSFHATTDHSTKSTAAHFSPRWNSLLIEETTKIAWIYRFLPIISIEAIVTLIGAILLMLFLDVRPITRLLSLALPLLFHLYLFLMRLRNLDLPSGPYDRRVFSFRTLRGTMSATA